MDKRFWGVIGVIVLLFGGAIFMNNRQSAAPVVGVTQHYMGNLQSKVTLTEYGDYQCPACSSFFPTVQSVKQKYESTVRFQFRNLPLTSLHPNAYAGARAAEAADLQGKFWEMHDAIYENQDPRGQSGWVVSKDPLSEYFVKFATSLGLNIEKFKKDFASATVNTRINADLDAFKATKEPLSTPTFFINDKKVDSKKLLDDKGQPSVEKFSKVLDDALAAQNK
ncbi:MAG: thioredoxin domain-containing protein [Candidatus Saccharimonadales bacterium]